MSLEQLQRQVEEATGLSATVRMDKGGIYDASVEINGRTLSGRSRTIGGVTFVLKQMVEEERAKDEAQS